MLLDIDVDFKEGVDILNNFRVHYHFGRMSILYILSVKYTKECLDNLKLMLGSVTFAPMRDSLQNG